MGHFQRKEFACKCGCGFDTVDIELLPLCEEVREFEGAPVIVSSGCRCKAHNEEIGGSKHSQHVCAKAADLHVADPLKTFKYLCGQYPNKYGFGLYSWGVHVDSRSEPARWDRR